MIKNKNLKFLIYSIRVVKAMQLGMTSPSPSGSGFKLEVDNFLSLGLACRYFCKPYTKTLGSQT